MLIYNITVKIDNDSESDWLIWQKDVYIPGVMASGFFYDHRFSKLISHEDADGKTYVMQFTLKMTMLLRIIRRSMLMNLMIFWQQNGATNLLHSNRFLRLCSNCE